MVLTPAAMPGRHAYAVLGKEPFIRLDPRVYAGQLIDTYLRKAASAERALRARWTRGHRRHGLSRTWGDAPAGLGAAVAGGLIAARTVFARPLVQAAHRSSVDESIASRPVN